MWILLLIFFSVPTQIERAEVLGTYFDYRKCEKRIKHAHMVGLPNNTNIGCVEVKGLSKTGNSL